MRITATSFETVEEITSSWGGASNLDDLFQDSFVEVLHGVDATALDETFGKNRKWDKICFMFPHITGKGRISLNRQLLAVSLPWKFISYTLRPSPFTQTPSKFLRTEQHLP